jgi:uncharacterized protein
MSKNFIKDPREVVKPGDVVKVKVLEVEVARKRMVLRLRLDDEAGSKNEAKGSSPDCNPATGRLPKPCAVPAGKATAERRGLELGFGGNPSSLSLRSSYASQASPSRSPAWLPREACNGEAW